MTQDNITNQLIERPIVFSYGEKDDKVISIYPASLGKTLLMARLAAELGINAVSLEQNIHKEIYNIIKGKRDVVLRLLAYYTTNSKIRLFDETFISKRVHEFDRELNDESLILLLESYLQTANANVYMKELGITDEQHRIALIEQAKDPDKGSVNVGGKTLYGALIDSACQRYGWTYDYVVWGISYVNLQLMMADAIRTIFLSEKERKRCGSAIANNIVSGDDPKNIARLKELINSRKKKK